MANDEEKPGPPEGAPAEGGDVVSLDDARKRAEEKQAAGEQVAEGEQKPNPVVQGILASVVQELAKLAGPDGKVQLGGESEAQRAKTAAVLRGIGAGLGAALAEAFSKWAEKVTITTDAKPAGDAPAAPAPAPATTPPENPEKPN